MVEVVEEAEVPIITVRLVVVVVMPVAQEAQAEVTAAQEVTVVLAMLVEAS